MVQSTVCDTPRTRHNLLYTHKHCETHSTRKTTFGGPLSVPCFLGSPAEVLTGATWWTLLFREVLVRGIEGGALELILTAEASADHMGTFLHQAFQVRHLVLQRLQQFVVYKLRQRNNKKKTD